MVLVQCAKMELLKVLAAEEFDTVLEWQAIDVFEGTVEVAAVDPAAVRNDA